MNFTQIKTAALAYADRSDAETSDMVETFAIMVTSRINRILKTMGASETTDEACTGAASYALPANWGGMRQISHVDGDTFTPMTYVTPEVFEDIRTPPRGVVLNADAQREVFYTIDDDNLFVYPKKSDGVIRYKYYLKADPISTTTATNWLSDDHPDCYINGITAEICSFVKDDAKRLEWEQRFLTSVNEIIGEDQDIRWSGDSLQMRTS